MARPEPTVRPKPSGAAPVASAMARLSGSYRPIRRPCFLGIFARFRGGGGNILSLTFLLGHWGPHCGARERGPRGPNRRPLADQGVKGGGRRERRGASVSKAKKKKSSSHLLTSVQHLPVHGRHQALPEGCRALLGGDGPHRADQAIVFGAEGSSRSCCSSRRRSG